VKKIIYLKTKKKLIEEAIAEDSAIDS